MKFFDKLAELERNRATFAVATVVARRSPVSSHLGDRAIIYADGRMEGFVGGACSRDLVRRHALLALRSGRPRLLQIRPDDSADADAEVPANAERVSVPMGCASNGAADVYIEPHIPPRVLVVVGFTPVADALARMAAAALEFEVVRVVAREELRDVEEVAGSQVIALEELRAFIDRLDGAARSRLAAVVASQGHYDERALEVLLRATDGTFIGLLSSRKRADSVAGVLAQQGVENAKLANIRNPVGIDIGARSAPEVAISILAEVIMHAPAAAQEAPAVATDVVCGMEVEIATAQYRAQHGSTSLYFCCAGCHITFMSDPDRYLTRAGIL